MAFADISHRSNTGLLGGLIASAQRRLELNRRYRQTVSELSQLTDRELADLGIARSQIKSIALETME